MMIGCGLANRLRLKISSRLAAKTTIYKELAGSTVLSKEVDGEPAIYAALYPRLSAVKAQILAARDHRIALTARVVVLEGGTPSTSATPPLSSDPIYDPAATVVVNAQRFSDFLDSVIALATIEQIARAALRARVAALENPPVPTPAFAFSGPASIIEGTPAAILPAFAFSGPVSIVEGNPPSAFPAFAFSGPATIAEGNPDAVLPAFAFTGPGTIAEGNPPSAQYGFAGPATIVEGN